LFAYSPHPQSRFKVATEATRTSFPMNLNANLQLQQQQQQVIPARSYDVTWPVTWQAPPNFAHWAIDHSRFEFLRRDLATGAYGQVAFARDHLHGGRHVTIKKISPVFGHDIPFEHTKRIYSECRAGAASERVSCSAKISFHFNPGNPSPPPPPLSPSPFTPTSSPSLFRGDSHSVAALPQQHCSHCGCVPAPQHAHLP
jgi:hypothetical protein